MFSLNYIIPGSISDVAESLTWPSLALLLVLFISAQTFRFVTFKLDHEIISMFDYPIFKTTVLRLSYYGPSEFPKRSLLSYEIKKKGFRKTLVLKTASSSQEIRTRKLDITFISASKISKIEKILKETIRENQN
ncbi:MAG: hypothetical protein EA358_07665 [Flavobacteriales bacterium]|nr:MAG: hypothetical protein EA358_07665 [Flavobacteriales bacterium]